MEPLDLTQRPPRGPREKLAGLVMLPRTIDKIRALMPGGDPGVYHIAGFSQRLLEGIGIELEALTAVVKDAGSDDEVAQWVREHGDTSKFVAINESMENRVQSRMDPDARASFEEKYGSPARLHDNLFDVIEADDREMFAGR